MSQTGHDRLVTRMEGQITRILRGFQYAGMALVVIMMFLTVVNSVGRYAFGETITGVIELSTFMLVMIIFLSIAYVQVKKGHVVVGVIIDRLSPRTQAIVDSINYLIILAVGVLAIWRALLEAIDITETGEVSLSLSIPFYPFYYVVAFGWVLFSLATLMNLIYFVYRTVKS